MKQSASLPLSFVLMLALFFASCAPKDDFIRISARVPVGNQITPRGPELAETREIAITQQKNKRPVKLFFVIDDSPSMLPFQEKLTENTRRWLDVIGNDFKGEIHSVTTTELWVDYNRLSSYNLNAIEYPELQADNSIKLLKITDGIGTRSHIDWSTYDLQQNWVGESGYVSPVRTLFSFDPMTLIKLSWTALDGKQQSKNLISHDSYQMLRNSLMGTFNGGSDQVQRLSDTLFAAINRGATGSPKEQPYCTLIHALKDTGRLNIFKPDDKVAFVFLQHGEADLVLGETCIEGYDMKAKAEESVNFVIEPFFTFYIGDVRILNDQNGSDSEGSWHQYFINDCDGTNSMCHSELIPQAKIERAKYVPLLGKWDGQIGLACSPAEEAAYKLWLETVSPWKAEFAAPNPKKKYKPGKCISYSGFGPIYTKVAFPVPKANKADSCNSPVASTLANQALLNRDSSRAHVVYERSFCYAISNSAYKTYENNIKTYFEGTDANSGPEDYAQLASKLMDEKIGRANYIAAAVTSTGTEDSACDPLDFKANSLIDLIHRSPSPTELVSICANDYSSALRKIERFALFESKRNYEINQLPTADRLLKIRLVTATGKESELTLDKVVISQDRKSLIIDKALEIEPGDKVLLDYGKERLDLDQDGYIYDVDCNDADPTGWSNCQDSDKDGYLSDSDSDDGNPEKH